MRTKKILPYAALLIIVLTNSFACKDSEGYSINDFRINIATVIPEGEISYSLLLDNGDKLWPTTSDVIYTPQTGQRVFVNYTLLSEKEQDYNYLIKINDIWNILTKAVVDLTKENSDSIGNSPVRVNDIWIGNNYLNIGFSFNYNGLKPHAINLIKKEPKTDKDSNMLELEFRHNSYNSSSNSFFDGFTCFNLKPFQKTGEDSIPIKVIVKDWNSKKEYELMYKYNMLNRNKLEAIIPNITSNEYK